MIRALEQIEREYDQADEEIGRLERELGWSSPARCGQIVTRLEELYRSERALLREYICARPLEQGSECPICGGELGRDPEFYGCTCDQPDDHNAGDELADDPRWADDDEAVL